MAAFVGAFADPGADLQVLWSQCKLGGLDCLQGHSFPAKKPETNANVLIHRVHR